MSKYEFAWRGDFENRELERLHAEAFQHEVTDFDWQRQVRDHSLGWVIAREGDVLVGFVNVVWDGATHAWIQDTIVSARTARQGIGTQLVAFATQAARDAGCEWLHVDFEDEHRSFYFDACGFTPTNAGLISL